MVTPGRDRTQFLSNSMKIRGRFKLPPKSTKNRGKIPFPVLSMKVSRNRMLKELTRSHKCGLSPLTISATVDEAVKDFTVQGVANEEFFVEEAPVTGFTTKDLIDQETAVEEATDKSARKKCTGRGSIIISSYADLEKEIRSAKRAPLKVTLSRKIPLSDAKVIMKKMKKSELFDVVNKEFLYYAVRELKRACMKLGNLERQLEYKINFGGGEEGKSIKALQSEVERLRTFIGKPKPDAEKQSVAKGSTRNDSAKKHIDQHTAKVYASKHFFGDHFDKVIVEMASSKKLSHHQEGTVLVSSYSDLKRQIKLAVGGQLNVTVKRTLPLVDAEIIWRRMKKGQLYRVVNSKFLSRLVHNLWRAREKRRALKVELNLLRKCGGSESQEKIKVLQAKVIKLKLLTMRKK